MAAFVRALVEAGEKVLLMGHHHAVMDIYKKELKVLRPGFITGRETDKQKEKAADDFMQGKTDLLCLSLRSASAVSYTHLDVYKRQRTDPAGPGAGSC